MEIQMCKEAIDNIESVLNNDDYSLMKVKCGDMLLDFCRKIDGKRTELTPAFRKYLEAELTAKISRLQTLELEFENL